MKETTSKTSTGNSAKTGLEIAVIGMAGRFPGASDIHQFWENLKNGVESVRFFSDQELLEAGNDPETISRPGYIKAKGYLEDAAFFDAAFFNYTPIEAGVMDPQIRLFHQCAWHALEDAGCNPRSYKGLIGLYAGYTPNMLWQAKQLLHGSEISQLLEAGNLNSPFFSTLVCYKLNLKGPGVTINTACSTSLTAVHLACRALLTGEADIVLAGGTSVTLPVKTGYEAGMIMSPTGRCRPFDAGADGTTSGNGVAVVVLKRLVKALKDRDHIYAVIKGSAINNDGNRKPGYTAPSVEAQAEVIRAARRIAGVEAESVTFIETHGTATPMGDPIELEALRKTCAPNQKKNSVRLGTLKANIGHLDVAAGISGFIKTVLALKHKQIPPAVNFSSPNPALNMEDSPFFVNTKLDEWPASEFPRRAGVSSFGIGGTNAHVVLEEAPEIVRDATAEMAEMAEMGHENGHENGDEIKEHLLLLSAESQTALDQSAVRLSQFLAKSPALPTLADAAYTLQTGRQDFRFRRMLCCRNKQEAVEALAAPPRAGMSGFVAEPGNRRVLFMFPGLGDHYVNMGRELYDCQPVFKEEADRCFRLLESRLDIDLKETMYPQPGAAGQSLNNFETAQAAVFVFEYALAKLLINWGITPHAMIGYSFGEYTAACLADVFSLEDALSLITIRGKLIRETPEGAMLSVPLSAQDAAQLLPDGVSVALDNGASCVVAGLEADVAAFEKQLQAKRFVCIRIQATHAIHTAMMDSITDQFQQQVGRLTLNPPKIPFISNVTGKWITPEDAVNPRYWAVHLRSTARFADGLKLVMTEETAVMVETGPGVALSTLAHQCTEKTKDHAIVHLIPSQGRDISVTDYFLKKIGKLWLHGADVDWNAYWSGQKRYRVPLPTYPFDRQPYPVDIPLDFLSQNPGTITAAPTQPLHAAQRPEQKATYAAPRNKAEELLTGMWQELLGISPLGIHDNLLDLGVNSINGITFINRLKEQLGEIIHITAIFDAPTVAELAEYFETHYPDSFNALTGKTDVKAPAPEKDAAGVTPEKIMRYRRLASIRFSDPEPSQSQNPPVLFILSPPRTGSTLLRVMLAGHPQLFSPPELNLLYFETMGQRKAELQGPAASHLQGVLSAVMQLKNCTIEEAGHIVDQFEKQDISTKDFYRLLQQWCGNRLLVDKSPGYANDPAILEQAERNFSNARYIHLTRHPYGMIRSYVDARMDLLGGSDITKMLDVTRQELAEMIWTSNVDNITRFLDRIPPQRKLSVRFEDLVSTPDNTAHEICRFLNLEFHPGMLEPYKEKKNRMTDGVHAEGHMIGDPKFHQHKTIDTSVGDSWKQFYKEDFLGTPTLETAAALGYHPIHELPVAPRRDTSPVSESLWKLNNSSGTAGDLFFIHEVSGEVGIYMEFCRRLKTPFNCWGIQADRLTNYTPIYRTTEELAALYIRRIKRIRPHGPYNLVTWSAGGNITFEMALQLQRMGESPALLAFVDCGGPMGRLNHTFQKFTLENELAYIDGNFPDARIREALPHITQLDDLWPAVTALLSADKTLNAQLKELINQDTILAMLNFTGLRAQDAVQYLNVTRTLTNACVHYIPSGNLHTPLHCFTGSRSARKTPEYWQDYCKEPINYHQVEGDHYSVFGPPHVDQLAAEFDRLLETFKIGAAPQKAAATRTTKGDER